MFKKAKRRGTTAVKCIFRVEVQRVTFPKANTALSADSPISVCFERGGKIASSPDTILTAHMDGTKEAMVGASLSLVVTLYKEDNGKYQTKEGKLIVRQRKKSALGGDAYRGLGMASLGLDGIMAAHEAVELTLPMTQAAASGGFIHCSVIPKIVGGTEGGFDDTLSMQSGISDQDAHINAADFESTSQLDIREDRGGEGEGLTSGEQMGGSGSASLQDISGGSPNAKSAVPSTQASMVELEATNCHLKEKLNEVKSNYESVCDENERLGESLRTANNEVRKAEERAEEATDAGTVLEGLLEEERRARREEVDKRVIAEREREEGYKREMEVLSERLRAAQQRLEEVENEFISNASTIEDLQAAVAAGHAREEALERDTKEVNEEMLALRSKEEKWTAERLSLERAAAELRSECEEAQGEVSSLQAQLKGKLVDEETLKSNLVALQEERDALRVTGGRIPELTSNIESLQKDLSVAKEALTLLSSEKDSLIASLRKDKETLQNEVKKMTEVQAEREEFHETIAVALRQSEEELASLRKECLTAQEQCAATQSKCDEVSSSLETSRAGSLHLSASICALERRVCELEEEKRVERVKATAVQEDHQKEVAALRKDIKESAAALRAKEAELQGARGEYTVLHSSYQSIEEKLSEARAETIAVREQLEQELTMGHKDEEHSIAVLTEGKAALQRELDSTRHELERSIEDGRRDQTLLREQAAAVAALEDDRRDLTAQLTALQAASLEKVNKIDDLGIALLSLKDELAGSRQKATQRQEAIQALQRDAEASRSAALKTEEELAAAEERMATALGEAAGLASQLSVEQSLTEALQREMVELQQLIEQAEERERAREKAICDSCEDKAGEVSSLRGQLDLVRGEMEEQREEGQRALEAKCAELEGVYAFLKEKDEEIAALKREEERASAEDTKESVALCGRLEEAQKLLDAVREELIESKRENEILAGEREGFETKWEEVATLTSDLCASQQRVNELQSEVSRQNDVITEQTLRIEDIQEQLRLSSESNEELSEEVSSALAVVLEREGEIRALRTQQEDRAAKIKLLEASVKDSEERLANLGEKKIVLEASRSEYKKKYLLGAEALTAVQLEHKIAAAKLERALKDLEVHKARERDREGQEGGYKEQYMCVKEELQLVRRRHQQAEDKWRAANGDTAPSFEVVESVMMEKDRRIEALSAETEELVEQLIAAKMDSANGSFELHQSLKRTAQLKRRAQTLGERVAALELKAAEVAMQEEPGAEGSNSQGEGEKGKHEGVQ